MDNPSTNVDVALEDIITKLDAEAFDKASKIIKKRFSEQIHLDDVQELRAEYKKKLSSIELQLSGMVQLKLDGVKRAMDVMKAANEQMAAVRNEFEGMHELCRKAGEQGKVLFDAYPRLKMINRARKNLERTLKEVTYYANLPTRVEVLVQLLESQPLQLRQVYLEGQQLETWRDELLRELKIQQAAFRAPPPPSKASSASSPNSARGVAAAGPTVSDRMQATFGLHLEEVKKLLDAIRKKIFSNISNCFEIVQVDPQILILTLEIVDMHESFQKEKASQAKERAEKNAENVEEALALSLIEDLRSDIVVKLKQKIDDRALNIFAQEATKAIAKPSEEEHEGKIKNSTASTPSPFSAMLEAATRILLDLSYLKHEVAPCFPQSYCIMDTYRSQYESHLVQQISKLYQKGFPDLDQGELLQLMEWLDYYNQEIINLGAAKPCPEFVQALSVCLQEYLVRVRNQMTEWFNNILNREQEVALNSSGQPITSAPEDFFNIIHLQVLVALSKLSADNMCAVIVVCLNVIKTILEEILNTLKAKKLRLGQFGTTENGTANHSKASAAAVDESSSANTGGLSLEILCATVNDYDRLQEKIQEFRDELEQMGKLGTEHLAMVDAAVDQVMDGFVSIANEANAGCSLFIFKDFREAITEELFSPSWEDSVDVMMQRVCMTFQDYYNDLSVWLPPFYFARLVRECLEKIVSLYFFNLFKRGRKEEKKKAFHDPLVVAQKIRNDRQALTEFFNEFEDQLKQAGLRETAALEFQMAVLDNVVDLFESGVTVESAATAPLLREFGSWAVEALVTISFLRGDKEKTRTELRESLSRYYDRFIKPNHLAPSASEQATGNTADGAGQSSSNRLSGRFTLSPFDPEVDQQAILMGVKRPKAKK